jgi:membrane protein YqaA with SNARE-associated domain
MHELFRQAFQFFGRMGGFGLVGFGILDSSFLFLPLGNDLLLVILTARKPELFWYYALMATLGSMIGATMMDAISRKLGEAGMERMANPKRVKSLQKRIEKHAWWVLGTAAILPPPFPFTVFLVAVSGMQMKRWKVLSAVAVGRSVRFFAIAALAYHYGRQILRMADRPEVEYFVIALAVISIIGSVLSVVKWVRSSRRKAGAPQQPAFAEG